MVEINSTAAFRELIKRKANIEISASRGASTHILLISAPKMTTTISFFDEPSTADEQASARNLLSYLSPKKEDDVRMVAAALKTHGPKFEDAFLDWAAPFGRYKAKGLWAKVRADPDALTEVIQRQLVEAGRRQRFRPLTPEELGSQQALPWRVKSVLPATGLAAWFGPSASGKSFLCIAVAVAIAEGRPFFGHMTRQAPVLYVGLEGEGGYRGRIIAWECYHGRAMPGNMRFLLQPFRLTDSQDVADLAAICPRGCVIIIDTLNRACPGMDENSSRDMGAAIEGAKTLQELTGGLVILVSHTGKDTAKGLRGHSSLFAALDAAVSVSRDGEMRSWKVEKSKDGKDGDEHRFRLMVVDIGVDEDGDRTTSCVVIADENAKTQNVGKELTASQAFGFATYNEAVRMHGVLDERGTFAGLHVDKWRAVFYQKSTADNDGSKRKAFARARDELVRLGRLQVHDDIYRPAGPFAEITEGCISETIKAVARQGTAAGHKRDMSPAESLLPWDRQDTTL